MADGNGFDNYEDYSISDSLMELMNTPNVSNVGVGDLGGLLGSLGGQLDIKLMLPQIMMGLMGSNGKGMEISRLLSDVSNVGNGYNYENSFLEYQKEYDDNVKARGVEQLKGAIPYLEPRLQRHFAIYIKLIELQSVVNYYTKNTLPYVVRDDNWQRNMLLSMRQSSSNTAQYDKFLKMMDMYNMMKNYGGIR